MRAVGSGRVEIVVLCKECGATDFDGATRVADRCGDVKVVRLCEEWGSDRLCVLEAFG